MNPLMILVAAGGIFWALSRQQASAAPAAPKPTGGASAPPKSSAGGGSGSSGGRGFGPGPVDTASFVVWDNATRNKLRGLHPDVAKAAANFIRDAYNRGIKLRITQGLRTYAEQEALYAQSRLPLDQVNALRQKAGMAPIEASENNEVTRAKPGSSYHNFGLAFDVVEIRDGKAIWSTGAGSKWDTIGALGKAHGLEWGGDWTSFKDRPHFQLRPGGIDLATVRSKYLSQGLAWLG